MTDDVESVDPLDLLYEPDEDLLLVALPFLEDGDGAVLLLVGYGDDPVVVGRFGARAVGFQVKEETSHRYALEWLVLSFCKMVYVVWLWGLLKFFLKTFWRSRRS